MGTIIDPLSDMFILYLLGDEKNSDILLDFINAVLTDAGFKPIVSVQVKNPFNLKAFMNDKLSILDVKATDDSGRIYDIEVQQIGNSSYKNRALYYWAKNYSDQMIVGDDYDKLKPVISISLLGLGFDLFKGTDKIHRCFLPLDKDESDFALIDHFQLHFIKLSSALKHHDRLIDEVNEPMREWIDYFLYEGREVEKMRYAIESNGKIDKAHETYQRFTASDDLRWAYEARQKAKMDQATLMAQARRDGEAKGEIRGKAEGKAEGEAVASYKIAEKLKKIGIPSEQIAEASGLSFEEIEKL